MDKIIINGYNKEREGWVGLPLKNVLKEVIYTHKNGVLTPKIPDYLIIWERINNK